MAQDQDASEYLSKGPCDSCGSSDARAVYSDGHSFCFACPEETAFDAGDSDREPYTGPSVLARPRSDLAQGDYLELRKRGISAETCRIMGYRSGTFNGKPCQIAEYRDASGLVVAQKLRFPDKEMPWRGEPKDANLFGSHRAGQGKRIVVTEGEIDALTVSQVQQNKWPVVSIQNGANNAHKDIAKHLEFLSRFDEIVLMFDMDEPGRAAAKKAAEVLPPGKVKIAELSEKDANACLQAGKVAEIVSAIWNAKPYVPDSVTFGQAIIDRLRSRPVKESLPFPDWLPELTAKMLGIRLSEVTVWTSGSGMGKTTMLKQLQHHIFTVTDWNQAIIHLEEPLEDTGDDLVSIHLRKRLRLPQVRAGVSDEEIHQAQEQLYLATDADGLPRLVLHDAFGSMGDETLFNRIRYYAHHHACRVIWLDHLSILVSDMGEDGDERRRIDAIMHKLSQLAVELRVSIQIVSHLRKSNGKPFEEGEVPDLDSLRGSGGIKQLAMNVVAMSRNQQADSERARNTSRLHVLKCRETGSTGPADWIEFDPETGCFEPGTDPDVDYGAEQSAEGAGF